MPDPGIAIVPYSTFGLFVDEIDNLEPRRVFLSPTDPAGEPKLASTFANGADVIHAYAETFPDILALGDGLITVRQTLDELCTPVVEGVVLNSHGVINHFFGTCLPEDEDKEVMAYYQWLAAVSELPSGLSTVTYKVHPRFASIAVLCGDVAMSTLVLGREERTLDRTLEIVRGMGHDSFYDMNMAEQVDALLEHTLMPE